ncbi:DUF3460 family protein [Pseudoduganella sp. RAF53_2]|jgi:hypothetical protein|uniref:DUF3460 family protein n=1 Tax=unclassified Pseudoduganella TaxID=2637179 RepID=UPI003F97CE2F
MNFLKQNHKYESDHTLFIKQLKEKNPQIEAGQQFGRSLLWDQPSRTLDEQERVRTSSVKQQAYVYQNKV